MYTWQCPPVVEIINKTPPPLWDILNWHRLPPLRLIRNEQTKQSRRWQVKSPSILVTVADSIHHIRHRSPCMRQCGKGFRVATRPVYRQLLFCRPPGHSVELSLSLPSVRCDTSSVSYGYRRRRRTVYFYYGRMFDWPNGGGFVNFFLCYIVFI